VRVFERVLLTGPERPSDLLKQVTAGLRASLRDSSTTLGLAELPYYDRDRVTRVSDGDTIVVDLADNPMVGSPDNARLLVAAWVRTVQGIVGRGDVGVRFRPTDGGQLFGHLASDRTWRQGDVGGIPLASIWIDDPSTAVQGPEITARGVASVFEAALRWELLRDGAVVDSGTMMASAGAPARGSWQVRLTGLVPGSYRLRVSADSPKDGSVIAQRSVQFKVTG
jgi:hypothetical protein